MSTREKLAIEAARLLYNRTVKEYKDAKEMAAESLGTKALPSNYEIAMELEGIVEEREGSERLTMLIDMRMIALEVMRKLKEYDPVLIGSVWRGTPRIGSDIDIVAYSETPKFIQQILSEYNQRTVEKKEFNLGGLSRTSTHISYEIKGLQVEVVVRPPRDREDYINEKCETYGDTKRGIGLTELEKLIQTDPLRRFIPKRRLR